MAVTDPKPDVISYLLDVDAQQLRSEATLRSSFDSVHRDITAEHFPLQEERNQVIGALFSSIHDASIPDHGMRPATMDELRAFGVQFSNMQRSHLIIATGSIWTDAEGGPRVGMLVGGLNQRSLELFLAWTRMLGWAWPHGCRFLAVKNS